MLKKSKKFVMLISLMFSAMLLVMLSSSFSIKADTISDYDSVSYSSYKANVVGKTENDYINKSDVDIEFVLPASIDTSKLMVQYFISDNAFYTWDSSSDVNSAFNDLGVTRFKDTLPYEENYIHSRIKLYGTDTIYFLSKEIVYIDKDLPVSGVVTSEGYTFGEWVNTDVTLNISDASDATSGIVSQTYRILKDGLEYTPWQAYSNSETPFSVKLTETGVYTIATKAVDMASNESYGNVVTVKIDKEIPEPGLLVSSTTQYWNNEDVVIAIRVGTENDFDRSGFSHYSIISIEKDGVDITSSYTDGSPYTGSNLVFTDSGIYSLIIRGYDFATNYYEYSYTFGIDKVAQEIFVTQDIIDKAVLEAVLTIDAGELDGLSGTKYYYLDGEYDESTFVNGYELTEDMLIEGETNKYSLTFSLNGYYTFASIDEVGNVFVKVVSINNIITRLTVNYSGQLSQVLGELSAVSFTATIDEYAAFSNVYWFVNGNLKQKGGMTYSFTPDATITGTYTVYAKINSDEYIVSNEYVITVSVAAATGVEIDYVPGTLDRTYGNELGVELVAVVDEGASADSATWFINDEPTYFALGGAVTVPYTLIKDAGTYEVKVFIQGDSILSDSVTITVKPYEIVVTPIEMSKDYGTEDPTFLYTLSTPLLYEDVLEGGLGREEGEEVGEYLMNLGTLNNPNYKLSLSLTEIYFKITSYDVDVTINHYGYKNETTGEHKLLDKEVVPVGINREYESSPKKFPGYADYEGENIKIVVTIESNVINYYYTPIEYEVIINHVSARDNTIILYEETRVVNIDQEITVYTRQIVGYRTSSSNVKFVMDGSTLTYLVQYNPVDVDITVNHLGYKGKLLETETINSYYGLTVQIPYKLFTGYSSPAEFYTYTISSEVNNLVNLSYITGRYDLTIHYVDESGDKIADDDVLERQEYDSTITIAPIPVEGYFAKLESATYTVNKTENNEYTFVYRKAIVPSITLIGEKIIRINIDSTDRYVDQKAYVNDYFSKDKEISGVWRDNNVPTYDKIGTFYLDYSYVNEDALSSGVVTRTIIIYDDTAPIINVGLEEEIIIVGSVYDYLNGVTYSDNYDNVEDLVITYESDLDTTLLGEYTITYTVKDTSGNSSSATRTVIVQNAKKAGDSFPIVPVIIGGVAGLLGILALIIVIILKKKKDEDDEDKTPKQPEKEENKAEKEKKVVKESPKEDEKTKTDSEKAKVEAPETKKESSTKAKITKKDTEGEN